MELQTRYTRVETISSMRNFASKCWLISVSIINCNFFTLLQEIKLGGRGIRSTPYEPYFFFTKTCLRRRWCRRRRWLWNRSADGRRRDASGTGRLLWWRWWHLLLLGWLRRRWQRGV